MYVNGTNISIAGSLVGNYNRLGAAGAGVYLDSASNHINIASTATIRQFDSGVQGNNATGIYTLDAAFHNNTSDLTGLTCASFVHASAVASGGASLCSSTTGDSTVGGALTIGGGIFVGNAFAPGVSCTGMPTGFFKSVNGIVTHC